MSPPPACSLPTSAHPPAPRRQGDAQPRLAGGSGAAGLGNGSGRAGPGDRSSSHPSQRRSAVARPDAELRQQRGREQRGQLRRGKRTEQRQWRPALEREGMEIRDPMGKPVAELEKPHRQPDGAGQHRQRRGRALCCGKVACNTAFVPIETWPSGQSAVCPYNENRTTVLFPLSKEQQHDR